MKSDAYGPENEEKYMRAKSEGLTIAEIDVKSRGRKGEEERGVF